MNMEKHSDAVSWGRKHICLAIGCIINAHVTSGRLWNKKRLFIYDVHSKCIRPSGIQKFNFTFNILPLGDHKPLPSVLPLVVTHLGRLFWNAMELQLRFSHNFLTWLKSLPFQRGVQTGEEPEVTRCQVGRVRSLSDKWCDLDQENLDFVGGISPTYTKHPLNLH